MKNAIFLQLMLFSFASNI